MKRLKGGAFVLVNSCKVYYLQLKLGGYPLSEILLVFHSSKLQPCSQIFD
jgi:hypothetical protein